MNKIELERRTKEFSLQLILIFGKPSQDLLGRTHGQVASKIRHFHRGQLPRSESCGIQSRLHSQAHHRGKGGFGDCLLAGIDDRGSDRRPQGCCQAFTGGQGDFGDIFSGRQNFQRRPRMLNPNFRNSNFQIRNGINPSLISHET